MTGMGNVKLAVVAFAAVVLLNSSRGQVRKGFPTPPAPAVREESTNTQRTPQPRVNLVEIEREAKEMSALAASVSGDVEQIRKGLLPSDAFDKLKRIEKLSKQLRGQLRP